MTGKVRAIGVSNFSVKNLKMLLKYCMVVPATNQIELYPCLPSLELKTFCEARGILVCAYSPFDQSLIFTETQFRRRGLMRNRTR